MSSSQDLLQETVFQLLSHHQSIEKTLDEVSSFRQICKDESVFTVPTDLDCLSLLSTQNNQTGSYDNTVDVYIKRLLSISASDQLSKDKQEELDTLLFLLKQQIQSDGFSAARLKDALKGYPRMQLQLLWTLHKEGIFSLENYFSMQQGTGNMTGAFLSKMFEARESGQLDVISGILSELLYLGFSEGKTGTVQKTACEMVDRFILDYIDSALKNGDSKMEVISLSSVQLDMDSCKRAYTHLLTVVLSHRPVMKVSQAIREQSKWAYGKIPPSLTHLFKQFLMPFEVDEVLALLRQVLEQQEVNWQLLLSFVSVTAVCLPETAKLFLEFTDGLLLEGLDSCEIETTIMGILLARQACLQGPHVFISYTDWFQRTFSDGSRSLASNRKSFTFLLKFLTDLVPYETAQHIKVHVLHPPFVPPKCRQILSDYITLAKTRLEDLKESLDQPDVDSGISSASDKGKSHVMSEVESAVKLFEATGKVPTSILEASIFRKPYYIGQLLPALLQPRPLPDVPDSKMRLIATLKRSDKIPQSMYTAYEMGCKREASALLEGVFIDSDSDNDMELSPFEQFTNMLQQLKNTVKSQDGKNTAKYTLSEVLSLLCERFENVLSISSQGHQRSAGTVTIDIESITIEPLQLKVIDALLIAVRQILTECFSGSNPSFTWLSKLVQSFCQYHVVTETLYKRILILVIKQSIALENHHIDCIAALLVEIQFLQDQLPWLQLHCNGEGHSCGTEKKTLAENIFDLLPVKTGAWMGFTLRLTTSFFKYMVCVHVDIDQNLVLPALVKKFFYLSTRQFVQLRNHGNTGGGTCGDNIVTAVFTSEIFQNFINVFPLTVSEWIDLELTVCPDDDVLSDFQRCDYFTWIIYRYFLAKGQGDYYSIATAVLTGILKNDLRISKSLEGCSKCCREIRTSVSDSRSYLVTVLQEVTGMFTHWDQGSKVELPWLPQQLINHFTTASTGIMKHSVVQQFFRLCLTLPAYLMFSYTPYIKPGHTTLAPVAKVLDDILIPHMSEGVYLPTSITVYLCRGLVLVSSPDRTDGIFQEFCQRCPIFMMSLMVNNKLVEPFVSQILEVDSPLKKALDCIGKKDSYCSNIVDPWQQAAVLFSITVDSAHSVKDSVWRRFTETTQDVVYRYKVCSCLVQMVVLQLTHIQNFQDVEDKSQLWRLDSVLSDVLKWGDKEHLAKIFLTDEIEEKTRACVNESLTKLRNLTVLRFFVHLGETSREKFHNVEFMTGILRAYCEVVTMFDHKLEQQKLLKDDELQSIDKFLVTLIESTSPLVLRQIDQIFMSLSLQEGMIDLVTCLINAEVLLELGSNPEFCRCDLLCLIKPK